MEIVNGKMVYGRKACTGCQEGQVSTRVPCSECKGTGRGKRGGIGKCKKCYGSSHYYSWEHPSVCPKCAGNYVNASSEDRYDYFPAEIWQSLTFKVYRVDRGVTFNEQYLGFGLVYSSVDYGDAWNQSDEKTIAKVRQHGSSQACKIVDDNDNLCDHIGIFVNRGGYAVKAVFEGKK